MLNFMEKSGVRIYSYNKTKQLTYEQIKKIISENKPHKRKIRTKEDEPERYTEFNFKIKSDKNVLVYTVITKRELKDDVIYHGYHDLCFSKKGFLIITGMTNRDTLLRYLSELLHSNQIIFYPKIFTKEEIEDFTDRIIQPTENKMHQPRFHFWERYRNREFNDFVVDNVSCATNDREYSDMLDQCSYFEPIFKIQKLHNDDFVTDIKLNRQGYIYSSNRMCIDDWLRFLNLYVSWSV